MVHPLCHLLPSVMAVPNLWMKHQAAAAVLGPWEWRGCSMPPSYTVSWIYQHFSSRHNCCLKGAQQNAPVVTWHNKLCWQWNNSLAKWRLHPEDGLLIVLHLLCIFPAWSRLFDIKSILSFTRLWFKKPNWNPFAVLVFPFQVYSDSILFSLTYLIKCPANLVFTYYCRIIGLVYNGCIALRPRPVYIRVQDLGGKAPWDTYGNLRYVYLQLSNIL